MNRPLILAVVRHDSEAVILQAGEIEVVLEGRDAGLASEILELCDGTRTTQDIARRWPRRAAEILSLLESLERAGIVTDCTRAYRSFHRHSANGNNPFFEERTDAEIAEIMAAPRWEPEAYSQQVVLADSELRLDQLLTRRQSAFPEDRGANLTLDSLSGVVRAMYRPTESGHWTVPSAGNLHPLIVHVAVSGQIDGLPDGLWWYDPERSVFKFVDPGKGDASSVMLSASPTDGLLEESQAVIFISADIERSARKYSNRAYRYALLEAGAVMQNASLAAAELGVKIRPVGGFLDSEAQDFLSLAGDTVPLLTLIIGG